jgi:uncharacterized pyridoxal phosphate-containing UPF0001 family protein
MYSRMTADFIIITTIPGLAAVKDQNLNICLQIAVNQESAGLSLIELLSALDIIRHSPHLKLVGLTSASPDSYEFYQALFQVRWYFPEVLVK